MANAMNTLAGILNLGDANVDFETSNLLQDTPVLAALEAVPSSHGHTHKFLRETVAASAGFRAINAGLTNTASQDELVTETLKFLDATWEDDVAIVKAMASGKGGVGAYVNRRLEKSLKAAMVGIEKQIIYGDQSPGDTGGFTGLIDGIDSGMVVDAGGTTADVQTSVYALRTGPTEAAVVYNGENDGTVEVDEVRKDSAVDGSGDKYSTYRQDVDGYLGFQLGNVYTVGRIANLNEDTDSKTLTDDLISDLLSLFPAGRGPSFLAMNRESVKQLQQSRTATNATGAPAPFPTEAFGVPIIVTDQIISTEAVVS